MKKRNIFLTACTIILVCSVSIGSAFAYFTTYTEAKGGYTISLGDKTTIEEPKVSEMTKHIVIKNLEGSEPVWVRARAFGGEVYELIYSDKSGKWLPNSDGYYYYKDILTAGQSTEELLVKIENIPEDAEDFDIVVVYETTPVLYDENGEPYADWTLKVDSGTVEGGAN